MKPRLALALAFALVLPSACRTYGPVDTARAHRSFRIEYVAEVPQVPPGAGKVALWIPLPETDLDQAIEDLAIESSHGPAIVRALPAPGAPARRSGRSGLGRSLYVESEGEPIRVSVSFVVTRYATRGREGADPGALLEALGADALIPLDGKVSAVAASLQTSDRPVVAARQLYEHTIARMTYEKPAGGQWGRGDAEWACTSRHGNCSDFHSYFIGLARSKGIPARFEIGFAVPKDVSEAGVDIEGYHCWAYFHDGSAWVPVDLSEADRHPELAEFYFGNLDEHRVAFTGGRDLVLDPPQAGRPLNFFIEPYAEVDGRQWASVTSSVRASDAQTSR